MDAMIVNGTEDQRLKTANEIEDMMHDAGRIARTAIMSDDAAVKKSLKGAVQALCDTALKRMDESIGASIADDDEE